jgi:hypothetical protein
LEAGDDRKEIEGEAVICDRYRIKHLGMKTRPAKRKRGICFCSGKTIFILFLFDRFDEKNFFISNA